MKFKTIALACLLLVLILGNAIQAQDLTGIKCIVMGQRPANDKNTVEYLDGTIYLCCPRCKAKFSGDTEKFSTKANHQLVVTGQYIQTACPSGHKIEDDKHTLKVAGVEVNFCNEEEMKKVAEASDMEAKVEMVFANASFKKTFGKKSSIDVSSAKCLMNPKKSANEKFAVDYNDGKVYFCCKHCAGMFDRVKDSDKIVARANEQLFVTGQYQQKVCPVGGHELNGDTSIELNGNKIKVCCSNCVGELEGLSSDEARLKKIFNQDNFAKSFEPKK